MAKLHDFYKDTVVEGLTKEFSYKSIMQVPRIEKITLKPNGSGRGDLWWGRGGQIFPS